MNVEVERNAKTKNLSYRIANHMSQINVTEYKTLIQNANIGGTYMLATQLSLHTPWFE